ncbi:MAG: hypothetical protein KF788_07430 [Piscinibacter sp.]|nr:hypothetical protein [Piscinibacter sp.]
MTGRLCVGLAAAGLAVLLGAGPARAQAPLFTDADLALGEQLLKEHRCAECHARKVGGDGAAIYRPAGRINSAGRLRGMVEYCNTELNLGMFPEDVNAVAAVLDRDHYHFERKRPGGAR